MIREAAEEAATTATESMDRLRDRRRKGRRRLEEIFSRDVLGSVLVSVAAGKIVEQFIVILAPGRPARLVAWTIAFVIFVWLFVRWEKIASAASKAADAAESAAESSE